MHAKAMFVLFLSILILPEDVSEAGGLETYRRVARFEKVPMPVVVQFSFDAEGRIGGFFVQPVPEPAPSEHEDHETKADLRLPFEGEWTVVWGGRTPAENYHVVIDHGEGEHSVLAHFQEGSGAVKTGQEVKPGQLLGLCGNSGNTTEPHLHYHLQTASTFGEGVGLPAQFQRYTADGEPVDRGGPRQGQVVAPGGEGSGAP